jgi:phosphatidylinositol glycan class O
MLKLLAWLAVIQGIGLYLFITGFFLTRFELDTKSECMLEPALKIPTSEETCWHSDMQYDRAILVIIDALRFDFANFTENKRESDVAPYENKLPIIHETLKRAPTKSRLFQFAADPPTVTMQRLKALTTGGLPTFIDFKDNFASSMIEEDNLIEQLHARGRKVVFMGDDTWVSLYPHYFHQAFPYPSFNVKDLHTVDNGVLAHLMPTVNGDDWDVVVAHFLGSFFIRDGLNNSTIQL